VKSLVSSILCLVTAIWPRSASPARLKDHSRLIRCDALSGLTEEAITLRRLSSENIPDPHFNLMRNGELWITGTGDRYLVYHGGWNDYSRGESPETRNFRFFHPLPGGGKEPFSSSEQPWGLVIQPWKLANGEEIEIAYAGVMIPEPGKTHARWPDDNARRRIVSFLRDKDGDWIRSGPVFSGAADWEGHCYDIDFFTDANGVTWATYARVDEVGKLAKKSGSHEESKLTPLRTQIYARRVYPPTRPGELPTFDANEILILGTQSPRSGLTLPSVYRQGKVEIETSPDLATGKTPAPEKAGVSLIEGPRLARLFIPLSKINRKSMRIDPETSQGYVELDVSGTKQRLEIKDGGVEITTLGFSANDFERSTYGAHFAIGANLFSLTPVLKKHYDDLANFSEILNLSSEDRLGAGRPELRPTQAGEGMLLFHAATSLPKDPRDLGHLIRSPYAVPFSAEINERGEVRFNLHSQKP